MKILFLSTPVGPLQNGIAGGVKNSILSSYQVLTNLGHQVTLLAPKGTYIPTIPYIVEMEGCLQPLLQNLDSHSLYPIFAGSFFEKAFHYIRTHQQIEYDLVINFGNDWLPYFMTGFVKIPMIHVANAAHINEVVSGTIQSTVKNFPNQVSFLSHAQAESLEIKDNYFLLGHGIDVKNFPFYGNISSGPLCYFGRISPEKGIEKGAEVARRLGLKLKIMGFVDDPKYFERLKANYSDVIICRGYLEQPALIQELSDCCCLIHLHNWVEALGLVILESFACGMPVVVSNRGGPVEIVEEGKTGFLVEPDNIEQAIKAVKQVNTLDRNYIRKVAEEKYSLNALAQRYKEWFEILGVS